MGVLTWVIEDNIFINGNVLYDYLRKHNACVEIWLDEYWLTNEWEKINSTAIFHGSLSNAYKIHNQLSWNPGSLCSTKYFECAYLYDKVKSFLLNDKTVITTISDLLHNKDTILNNIIEDKSTFFVRPNSPLKEFSGRVLSRDNINEISFDYGFYHKNIDLEIVISPVVSIENEWRFIVVNNIIVTACSYEAKQRKGIQIITKNKVWDFAQEIANLHIIPDLAYVIDICESENKLYLLEFNPFSGADMYVCDAEKIVKNIEKLVF